jgi:2,3-bisphosphoglycerate-dependent phosphoglycerate mutase
MWRLLPLSLLLGACRSSPAASDVDGADSASDPTTADPADTAATTDTADTQGSADTGDTGGSTGTDTGDTATTDTFDQDLDIELSAPITVYAVRHCEKEDTEDDDDPGLTEEGQARAEALAVLMAGEPLKGIYATDKRRTQQTVQPTADDHGLEVVTDIEPEAALPAHILATHAGQTLLHAGHSYTLPDFMEAFEIEDFDVDDYGQLWTLTIAVDGVVTISESTFGE